MITSKVGRGLIYAGDSPFDSSIIIEQTGPMELTVRAGSLTTTGSFRVVTPNEQTAQILADKIVTGESVLLPDGRVRVYLSNGEQVLMPVVYTLTQDQIISITPDLALKKFCVIELGVLDQEFEILVRYRLDNGFDYPPYPTNWIISETLVHEFNVSPGQTELPDIDVLSIRPGFPPGTGPEDWILFQGVL